MQRDSFHATVFGRHVSSLPIFFFPSSEMRGLSSGHEQLPHGVNLLSSLSFHLFLFFLFFELYFLLSLVTQLRSFHPHWPSLWLRPGRDVITAGLSLSLSTGSEPHSCSMTRATVVQHCLRLFSASAPVLLKRFLSPFFSASRDLLSLDAPVCRRSRRTCWCAPPTDTSTCCTGTGRAATGARPSA